MPGPPPGRSRRTALIVSTGMVMVAPLSSVMTRSLPVTALATLAEIVAVPAPSSTVTSFNVSPTQLATFAGGAQNIKTVTHELALAQPVVLTASQTVVLEVSLGGGDGGNAVCQLQLDVTMP